MDIKKETSSFLNRLKKVFNTDGPYFTLRFMAPALEGYTEEPLPKQPTTWPLQETTTVNPYHKWFQKWFHDRPTFIPFHLRTTPRSLLTGELNTISPHVRLFRERTTVRTKIEHPLIIQSSSPFGLENCLWVAIGGVGVLILMAIFMKLGQPIRRVRRQLSNNRPAPDVTTLNRDDANLDMGSLLRLGDTAASTDPGPLYDPPPLYVECVDSSSSIYKYDSEEPPPRYSATFENLKDAEPKVHIRKQNVQNNPIEEGIRVELVAKTTSSNESYDVASEKRSELVFDNGRIVERLSLDLNGYNTEP